MGHLSPKQRRELYARFVQLRQDYKKEDCYNAIARDLGVSVRTVRTHVLSQHRAGVIPAKMSATQAPVEPLTSSDFEITASQPTRQAPVPKANHLLDETGRYTLSKPERWLVLPDTQIPYHDERAIGAVLKYAKQHRYDGCIQLGDFMDWDFCSRWTADNARKAEGQRFLSEYVHGNAVLDEIQDAVRANNPNAHLIVIEGNHDWRIQNVIDKTPFLEGLIDVEPNLRFNERNAVYWRYWVHRKPVMIGKAHFIHGDYIGVHHAKKTADSYHRNVFYGHTHTLQAYTKTTLAEDSVQCWSLGTLSRFDLEYMGKRPSSWMQCFAEFFFREDGSFNHYVTNIVDHSFTAIDGKDYHG